MGTISVWGLAARSADGQTTHDQELIFLSVHLEFHFVLIDREVYWRVGRKDFCFARFLLTNLIFQGGCANRVLLADNRRRVFLPLVVGAAIDGLFGNDGPARSLFISPKVRRVKKQNGEGEKLFSH